MFTYRKMCILIKMGGETLYAAYTDDDFVKNETLHDNRNADCEYIITETCNIFRLY